MNLMNENIEDLESIGVIEKIPNLDQFIWVNPTCSFIPRMPIFKLNKEATKSRRVFMSNLSERSKDSYLTINHNQAMYAR